MKASRSALLALMLDSSVARKLSDWWKPTRTASSKRRDPSDPRQAVLIAAAHAKRERRAVKLARDYARCIGGAFT